MQDRAQRLPETHTETVVENLGEHEARGRHVFQMLAADLLVRLEEVYEHMLVDFYVTEPPMMRVGSHAKSGIGGDVAECGTHDKRLSLHDRSLNDGAG